MPQPRPAAIRNRLLASLPPEAWARLRPGLEHVTLASRQPIYGAGTVMDAVHFPEAGMVSLVANLDDGTQAEVGVVGREGMLGVPLLSGVDTSFAEAMVQMPGSAWRMTTADFRRELEDSAALRLLLNRYGEALQAQVMQTAACNSRHGLEQRLMRWLLMAHDRADRDELALTQEFMAMMLGVARPTLTAVAGALQQAGLIRYARGYVTVLDRPGLEAAACECHGAVERRFATLLGDDGPQTGTADARGGPQMPAAPE